MELKDYPRPERDNGRGMHWSAIPYHTTDLAPWIARLTAMNIRWLKVLDDGGGSSLDLCARLLEHGIMPIVRLYREKPNPGRIGGSEEQTIRALVKLGVRYIETNNEPDLQIEWQIPRPSNWLEIVADNWLYDASRCLDAGALPAVPALSVGRKDDLVKVIVERGGKDALLAGAWIALHNYAINHPLDYPDDDVNQRGTPLSEADYAAEGEWAWDGIPREQINAWRWQDKNPGATIADDPACFRSFEFVNAQVVRALGVSLPIISTEGGIVMGWRDDRRYQRITPRLHCERTVAMYTYMQTAAPDYYFVACPWLLANFLLGHFNPTWESQAWFTHWWDAQFGLRGQLPTVEAVMALPSISRLEKQGPHHSAVRGDVAAIRGVGGLRVVLRSEGFSAAATTAVDGSFAFTGLGAGDYALQAGGLVKAGLQLDGTNTITLAGLRPPVPAAPEREWDRRLSDLRVTIIPAQAAPGQRMWKLIRAHLLDRTQTNVAGAVSINVLDEIGRPVVNQEVVVSWPGGASRKATEPAQPPAYGASFPLSTSYDPVERPGPYTALVDGLPSDKVTGLGLPLGEPVGFVLVFQRVAAASANGSTIEGTITPAGQHSLVLRLPNGTTRAQSSDQQGRFSFTGLMPGLYDIEVDKQGIVGRSLQLDGTNTVVFDYSLPNRAGTLRGTVIGGQAGLDVFLSSTNGENRRTTVNPQGRYEFTFLPAGTYTVRIGSVQASGLRVDGRSTLEVPPLDVRPRPHTIAGTVRTKRGQAIVGETVRLSGPQGAESTTLQATTGGDGSFEFSALLPGAYTVSVRTLAQDVLLRDQARVVLDLVAPPQQTVKSLRHVVLLGPPAAPGSSVNLRLAQRYIRTFRPTVSFRVEEAERAEQVLIIGDLQAVSDDDEERLRDAGCQVARVGGTPYAVEDTLARLVAAGTPMPKGRTALVLPRRKPEV